MSEVTLNIEAEVNLTEDPEKVKKALENLFVLSSTELIVKDKGGLLIAKAKGKEGLAKFYTLLRQERILAAAGRVLTKGTAGNNIIFCLNKQAACMRRISFCEPIGESPLGPIRVEIKTNDPKALIDRLTSRTG